MFFGPLFFWEEFPECEFEDTKSQSIYNVYKSKSKIQKRTVFLLGNFLLLFLLIIFGVFSSAENQLDIVQVIFASLLFSISFSLVSYLFLNIITKNRFIKLIIRRLEQISLEKQNIEKILLQLSTNIDQQVQKKIKNINLEKSSAFRTMEEAIKSQKSYEISENSLRRMLNKLSLTLESSGIGVWNWDIYEDRIWFDDQMHKLLNLDPKTFTGSLENFINLFIEENSLIRSSFDFAKSKGGFKNLELTIKNDDYHLTQILLKGKTFYGLQNQPIYMSGVCWDISQEKKTQERIHKFFSLSVDLFCVADCKGLFRDLSPDWSSVLGFSLNELKSQPFIYFVHPQDRKKTQAEFKILLSQSHRTVNFENRYKCKNGMYRNLLWNAVSIPDEDLIYAIARDITDYKSIIIKNKSEFVEDQRSAKVEFSI